MFEFWLAQLVALGAGALVLLALGSWKLPLPLFVAGAWLAGSGLFAAEYQLLALLRLPWNPVILTLPWLAVAVIVVRRFANSPAERAVFTPLALRSYLLRFDLARAVGLVVGVLISGWVLGVWWQSINQPLISYDSLVVWAFKGRELYHSGTINPAFFTDPVLSHFDHADYPLLVPLAIARAYNWTGDNDMLVKGWWVLIAGAGLAGVYWGLAGFAGLVARLGGLLLVFTIPSLFLYTVGPYVGYADSPLAVMFLFAAIFLYRCWRTPSPGACALSALFFCLAAFTKNEGLPVALVGFVLLALVSWRHVRLVWPGLVAGALFILLTIAPWQVAKAVWNIHGDLSPSLLSAVGEFGSRAPIIARQMLAAFLAVSQLNIIWPALLLLLIGVLLVAPRRWYLGLLPLLLIGAHMSASVVAYLTTPYDLNWHLDTSLDRIVFQPVFMVALLATIYIDLLLQARVPAPQPTIAEPTTAEPELVATHS